MSDVARLSLKEARELLEWTPGRLADESGIKLSAVYDIEAGRNNNPGYQTVSALVKALKRGGLAGVQADDIFGADEATSSETRAS
jgi:transcriptional regulator with XRE-family HTH domain